MNKTLNHLAGTIENISAAEYVELANGKSFNKVTITLITDDGQRAFFEARDRVIQHINSRGITIGHKVTIGYIFLGITRNNKNYNNLIANAVK